MSITQHIEYADGLDSLLRDIKDRLEVAASAAEGIKQDCGCKSRVEALSSFIHDISDQAKLAVEHVEQLRLMTFTSMISNISSMLELDLQAKGLAGKSSGWRQEGLLVLQRFREWSAKAGLYQDDIEALADVWQEYLAAHGVRLSSRGEIPAYDDELRSAAAG